MKTVKTFTEAVDGTLTQVGSIDFTEKEYAKYIKNFNTCKEGIIVGDTPTADEIAFGKFLIADIEKLYGI